MYTAKDASQQQNSSLKNSRKTTQRMKNNNLSQRELQSSQTIATQQCTNQYIVKPVDTWKTGNICIQMVVTVRWMKDTADHGKLRSWLNHIGPVVTVHCGRCSSVQCPGEWRWRRQRCAGHKRIRRTCGRMSRRLRQLPLEKMSQFVRQ